KGGKPALHVDEKSANPVLARIQCCQGRKGRERRDCSEAIHPSIQPTPTHTPRD
ncbi:hypothetical protein Pcinc_036495, partial [Petrolisthes cinctipes]